MRRLGVLCGVAATLMGIVGAALPAHAQRADQLVVALITSDDLPDGWVQTKPSQVVRDAAGGVTCNDQAFLGSQLSVADVSAEFALPDQAQLMETEVTAFTGGGAAATINDSLAAVGAGMQCMETNGQGGAQTLSIVPVTAPSIGDQAAEWQVTILLNGVQIPGELLVFRRGELLSTISVYAFGDAAVDDGMLQAAAQKADARLRGFQG